jgi:hypothetical protein
MICIPADSNSIATIPISPLHPANASSSFRDNACASLLKSNDLRIALFRRSTRPSARHRSRLGEPEGSALDIRCEFTKRMFAHLLLATRYRTQRRSIAAYAGLATGLRETFKRMSARLYVPSQMRRPSMLQRGLPGWTGQSLKQGGRVMVHRTECPQNVSA